MGCWNGTCAISNLHITAGQDVVVLLLLKNNEEKTFCYENALYDVCPVPFYGKYDDYGGVDDCHGHGLNIVVESLRQKLYEFGQGANQYHDIEVRRASFDISALFEADKEDRLGIEEARNYNGDAYKRRELEKKKDEDGLNDSQQFELDRLANKIRKVDSFRRVTHIQIHGDVYRGIMNKWYIEDYVGADKGNKGYSNSYVHVYFKDIEDSIPEYIRRVKEQVKMEKEAMASMTEEQFANPKIMYRLLRSTRVSNFDWNDPCLAGRWLEYFKNNSNGTWGLVDIHDYVEEYKSKEDWEGLAAFAKEVLSVAWLNSFMASTRKIWTQQTGMGSQRNDPVGYTVLAETVLSILAEEKRQYDYDTGEDENFNPDQLELEFEDE